MLTTLLPLAILIHPVVLFANLQETRCEIIAAAELGMMYGLGVKNVFVGQIPIEVDSECSASEKGKEFVNGTDTSSWAVYEEWRSTAKGEFGNLSAVRMFRIIWGRTGEIIG